MAVPRDYNPYAPTTTDSASLGASLFNTDINLGVASENTILQGATLRTSNFAGRTATVKPGENINAALGTLKSAGGGVLFLQAGTYTLSENIIGSSKISIIGEGRDQTILDFGGGAYGIKYEGTSTSIISSFKISDLTVQNSGATSAVSFDYADNWTLSNVLITSCDNFGYSSQRCQNFKVSNVSATLNGASGFIISSTISGDRRQQYFSFENCTSTSNTDAGFYIDNAGTSRIRNFNFLLCTATSNTDDGFIIDGSSISLNATFIGCVSDYNLIGYDIDCAGTTFIGCTASNNTSYGVDISIATVFFGGALDSNNSNASQVNMTSDCTFALNSNTESLTIAPRTLLTETDEVARIAYNRGGSYSTEKKIYHMYNGSGATRYLGDTVVFSTSTGGDGFTTTTTVGDDAILGMVLETIASGNYGAVLVEGATAALKVDGTTDIAVGDFLCAHSTAGIAQKAGAGDMAFARARETYTTNGSNGVIDALLITPRKL